MGFIRNLHNTKLEQALKDGSLDIGENTSRGAAVSRVLNKSEELGLGVVAEKDCSIRHPNFNPDFITLPIYANEYLRIGTNHTRMSCPEERLKSLIGYYFKKEDSDFITALYVKDNNPEENN